MKRFYLCAVLLAFCSAQAELPPLVPRKILFGNPARTDPKISPDGSQLTSPLYHFDAIRAPLLIGQGKNDPRVTIANADAMVAALREVKREVTYVVYPDEGHGFAGLENQFDFYGRVEEFLAKHLDGRAEPWKKITASIAELK